MFRRENTALNKQRQNDASIPDEKKVVSSKNGTIYNNYNHYFSTGLYKLRYPRVNYHTLSFIQSYINNSAPKYHILDYGCGNGRYLINILRHHLNTYFTAYDISKAPLRILREKLIQTKQTSRVQVLSQFNLLTKLSDSNAPFDMALLLFGVLSHISSKSERQRLLIYLRNNIGSGHLILSVPNQKRRFLSMQRAQNSHDITYTHHIDDQIISLYYHLYSEQSIKQELTDAGLNIIKITAESVLPESWVTRVKPLGWLDHQLCKLVPARWGYGILICCQKRRPVKP
ncbi:hypothetical protein AB835_14310 [Candidatus Endobugula sertula]|uniref:Methyltransferase domain-containing protein n=1 Tax=Candidatus Endobugula sertula TaxID=62101 RepID=A0A1D2QLH0_9GAMM|nr:hypothetical protein AB835_14310 [Candidatus Endobugula sertula]